MFMAFQVSPGVNVSEVDLTTIVPAVSTTEGGIAAHLSWGPVQKRILVESEDVLANQFGKPNANTAADFFTAASFLGYGNKLFVVRVINEATGTSAGRNAITTSSNTMNTIIENDDDYELNFSSGITGVGHWVAKYPGEKGNSLRISVCPSSNAWTSTLNGTLAFTNNSLTVTGAATSFTSQIRIGDILLAGPDRTEVVVSAVTNATSLTLKNRYVGNTVAAQSSVQRRWEFFNFFDAAPGTSEYAALRSGSNDEMHIVVADQDGVWTGAADTVLERFSAVSKALDALTTDGSTMYYKNVINDRSQYVWWTGNLTGVTSIGRPAEGVNFGLGTQARPINDSFIYGRDGALPRSGDYLKGYDKFNNPEEVDVSFILGGDGNSTKAIHIINNIAEKRKDCIAVLSPRRSDVVNNSGYVGKEVEDTITFRNLLPSSSYAVLDNGYKYIYDKYNDVYRYVPLNGDTAGLMVRTDTERDPWFSPAGFNRGQVKNVIKLATNPTKGQRDQLYKNGINPVTTFPGQGTILFGDKTLLSKPSAFDRINVRRLFIVLEKAIATAAKFTLFEFNDEFTRAQFRNLVEPFLRDVQGRRGIYDFRVVCDETNNTPEVIDRNEFVGDIYIKPARSINFIQLNFVAVRTGVEFSEIVGNF
jgi:hypothetical protein